MGAALIGGCGEDDFPNEDSPPTAIVLSAAISGERVSVSPSRFGAGSVKLIVTNQTKAVQVLTLRAAEARGTATQQRTGPINPNDTASLTADLVRGRYALSVRDRTIGPATLVVGSPRASAKDRLLKP